MRAGTFDHVKHAYLCTVGRQNKHTHWVQPESIHESTLWKDACKISTAAFCLFFWYMCIIYWHLHFEMLKWCKLKRGHYNVVITLTTTCLLFTISFTNKTVIHSVYSTCYCMSLFIIFMLPIYNIVIMANYNFIYILNSSVLFDVLMLILFSYIIFKQFMFNCLWRLSRYYMNSSEFTLLL